MRAVPGHESRFHRWSRGLGMLAALGLPLLGGVAAAKSKKAPKPAPAASGESEPVEKTKWGEADGKEVDVLIDGGSAIISVRALQSALGSAVAFTLYVPGSRFDRFAAQVLGSEHVESGERLIHEKDFRFDRQRRAQVRLHGAGQLAER